MNSRKVYKSNTKVELRITLTKDNHGALFDRISVAGPYYGAKQFLNFALIGFFGTNGGDTPLAQPPKSNSTVTHVHNTATETLKEPVAQLQDGLISNNLLDGVDNFFSDS
jgi:hypothetical protein